jgi:hypothetical protein
MHRDVCTNVLTNNIPVRVLYAGEPSGPNYKPNWSTYTLTTAASTFTDNPVTVVQQTQQITSTSSVTSTSITFNAPNSAGNTLILAGYTGGGTVTVTDNAGSNGAAQNNIWQSLYNDAANVFVCYNCQGTTSPITVTIHGTVSGFCIIDALAEISGGVNTVDQTLHGSASAVTTFTTGNINVAQSPSIALVASSLSTQRESTSAPWVDIAGLYVGTPFAGFSYDVLSGTGNTNATLTLNQSANISGYRLFNLYAVPSTISGNAGIAGATVFYSGVNGSGSVVADALGNYSIPNLPNGIYTITPSKTGYTFSPTSSIQNVSANTTGVNFTATAPAIASDAPMIGVLLPVLKARIRIAMAQKNRNSGV